jgi:serine protease inhibitor
MLMRPTRSPRAAVAAMLAVLVLLGGAGCAATTASPARSGGAASSRPPGLARSVAGTGSLQLALDLDHTLGDAHANLVVSPSSLASALSMALAGARGQTAAEIAQVLHASGAAERVPAATGSLDAQVARSAASDGIELRVANALWPQQGLPLRAAFVGLLTASFKAAPHQVDFRGDPEGARAIINAWVAAQTEGKIRGLFPPGSIDPSTRLALTNAVYLKAPWQHPFDGEVTTVAPFHLLGGGTSQAQMLRQQQTFGYAKGVAGGTGWQAVELPYQGGRLAMDVLLPDAGGLDALQRGLDHTRVEGILRALRPAKVALWLPKFEFDASFDLTRPLAALGMPTAFSTGADFSGMTGTPGLSISAAVQKAHIEVNEQGTIAAAATGLAFALAARTFNPTAPELRIDRPFLFFIRDLPSGQVLFTGRVTDPGK